MWLFWKGKAKNIEATVWSSIWWYYMKYMYIPIKYMYTTSRKHRCSWILAASGHAGYRSSQDYEVEGYHCRNYTSVIYTGKENLYLQQLESTETGEEILDTNQELETQQLVTIDGKQLFLLTADGTLAGKTSLAFNCFSVICILVLWSTKNFFPKVW